VVLFLLPQNFANFFGKLIEILKTIRIVGVILVYLFWLIDM